MTEKIAASYYLAPDDDENIASVYFKFDDGYFTLARNLVDDETIYWEMDDQSKSTYSNDCKYEVKNNRIILNFSKEIAQELGCDTQLVIKYDMPEDDKILLQVCLDEIFDV